MDPPPREPSSVIASDTTVLVWRYGARKGVTIPPEVAEQLRLAHELREHLVELAY